VGVKPVLGWAYRMAVINRVRELGGAMMGNGPTATKGILALHPQRMIEIQHNEYWNYLGHLQSPLGYAGGRQDFGNWVRALKLGMLLVGTSYGYTHEISRHAFPLTPIELHSGYLLGTERIIATHSGNYGWPGEKSLVQVRYFDAKGKLTPRDFPTLVGTEARTAVKVEPDEAIVLVKLPIAVKAEKATISEVQYGPEGLKLKVLAPRATVLEVRAGEMAVKPGQKFTITDSEGTTTTATDKLGVLRVTCDGKGSVEVKPL